jgi:hypothetical protein
MRPCKPSPMKDFECYPTGSEKQLEDVKDKHEDIAWRMEFTLMFIFLIYKKKNGLDKSIG